MHKTTTVACVWALLWMGTSGQAAATEDPQQAEAAAKTGFRWEPTLLQSFFLLSIEHSSRPTQAKTWTEFKGKFWKNDWTCIRNIRGWEDRDSFFTNYIAHPMQGAVASFIRIHNDPGGVTQEFGRSGVYWLSRLKAMGWSAAYSTQLDIGPVSEATNGHVHKRPGTAGLVDLVVTPVGGLGMVVLEDALDSMAIREYGARSSSLARQRFLRVSLNLHRTFANMLRLKRPWHRDTRGLNRWGVMASFGHPATVSATVAAARERAEQILRLGTVRVRTPTGTDFMFRIGMRPIHHHGDGGADGVLRVAPVELSSFGQIRLAEWKLGEAVGKEVTVEVDNGRISRVRAAQGADKLVEALAAMGEAAHRFAEFSIGYSEGVASGPAASGTVCLGFGGNEELKGKLPGRLLYRHCLADATVHVDFRYLVRDGKVVVQ